MISIREGDIIRHHTAKDICFVVQAVQYRGPTYIKLKTEIINMAFVETYPIGIKQKLMLEYDILDRWEYCTDNTAKCIRYVEWKKIKK